jgi:uncharacterized membrane protein (DUF485 family)
MHSAHQQPQLNLDNQTDVGKEKKMDEEKRQKNNINSNLAGIMCSIYFTVILIFSFLDHQVLAFLSLIAARITANIVQINFVTKMSNLDENQRVCVNRLLQL